MDCLILQVILWLPQADFCKDYVVGGGRGGGGGGEEKHIPLQALLSSLYHTALFEGDRMEDVEKCSLESEWLIMIMDV